VSRILVIDDDYGNRVLLRHFLELEGHEVVEAGDGREGVIAGRGSRFDLVFTDMLMPEKDGIEVIMELLEGDPQMKIIAISGGGRGLNAEDNLRIAEQFGALGTIAKPFEYQSVVALTRQLLGAYGT
jgi:CheY-like chemotaxis protein